MNKSIAAILATLALGCATALPVWADGPGRGNGNGPPERRDPGDVPPGNRGGGNDRTPPVSGVTPPGHGGTPPGLGGNPPPGHGGPNPGRGRASVSRGQTRICGTDGPTAVGPLGQAGASHVGHVNFAPSEDSDSASWARMTYFWIGSSFDFVLNAHQLEAGSQWTLLARAVDGSAICLANGAANPGGELHLAATQELASHLPDDLDPFAPTPTGEEPAGATLELVPSISVDCAAGSTTPGDDTVLISEQDIRFVDVEEVICPG